METQTHEKQKKILFGGIAVVVLLLLILLGLGGYWLVYRSGSDNGLRNGLVSTLPLPVATIDGSFVSLEEYEENVDSILYFLQQNDELNLDTGIEGLTPDLVRENELERMIELHILENIAEQLGIVITDEDVDAYFESEIVPQAPGGIAEVEQTLADLYGWTPNEFKRNVLYEVVLQQNIEAENRLDQNLNDRLVAVAEEVLEIVNQGEEAFSDLSAQYSTDPITAQNAGSIGVIQRGQLAPSIEEVVFGLEIGENSGVVPSDAGYHIFRVVDKDEEADTVDLSHILIGYPSIAEEVALQKDTASIHRFLPKY